MMSGLALAAVRQRIRAFYAGDRRQVSWLVNGICIQAKLDVKYGGDVLAYALGESIGGEAPIDATPVPPPPLLAIVAGLIMVFWRQLLIVGIVLVLALIALAPRLDAPSMWGDVRPRAVPSSSPFDGTPKGSGSSPYEAHLGASAMRATAHERQRHPYAVATSSPESVTSAPATVVASIHHAAAEWGQDAEQMVRVAFCESRFDNLAVGKAGERGLFQFLPSTWERNAARLGYTPADVWDPLAAARVTAEMWSRQQQWQWTCWKGGSP